MAKNKAIIVQDGITLIVAFKTNNLYIIRSKKTLKEQCKISAKLSHVISVTKACIRQNGERIASISAISSIVPRA